MTPCKPIIFSGPMVRAILAGTKTQTRRVLKPQPICHTGLVPSFSWGKFSGLYPDDWFGYGNEIDGALPCAPGDLLWVREAFYLTDNGDEQCAVYAADDRAVAMHMNFIGQVAGTLGLGEDWVKPHVRLRSPIHMPRWASRITLEVTAVKVHRLQDISEEDAKAEGLACLSKDSGRVYKWGIPDRDGLPGNDDDGQHWQMWCIGHKPAFAALWNSIHGPDAWDANPWVAAYTFRRVE